MVKIFFASTSDLSESAAASFSYARQKKAASYLKEQDRLLSLAAGLALDKGLRECGLKEKEVRILLGERGKPYLPDYPSIHFSLSHSGERALAVFSNKEIGCDLERVRPIKEEVVRRCFSKEEQAYVEKAENKDEAFTRVWVYKESFLKALGVGLGMDLPSFTALPAKKGIALKQSADPRDWRIEEIEAGGYIAAFCAQK